LSDAAAIPADGHGHGHAHGHHRDLQHHFDSLEQQHEAATLGMWLFLVTEVLFFGGLFMAYMLYRIWYPEAWSIGSSELDIRLGGFNTVVLIGSSLTMAMAVRSAQTGFRRATVNWLIATMVLGLTFLVVKYFEYAEKFSRRPVASGTGWSSRDLLLAVLHDDGSPRVAHDHRVRPDVGDHLDGLERPLFPGMVHPGRDERPVLALR
jgi:hypothetical protein